MTGIVSTGILRVCKIFAVEELVMNRSFFFLATFLSLANLSLAQQPAAAPAHHHARTAAKPSADRLWDDLLAGNERFISGQTHAYDVVALRRELATGQQPNVIVLSCSDSRVAPELVFDHSLGDLFVVRTAGNVADPVGLGSIEYAVDHMHPPLLVVLGHQKCGAVTAACSGEKMPSRNLEAIVDKIDPAVAQAKTYAKSGNLIESAIKENVDQSAKDLLANSDIIRAAVTSGKLKVIEAEYELDSGKVVRLSPSGGQN